MRTGAEAVSWIDGRVGELDMLEVLEIRLVPICFLSSADCKGV